MGHLVRATAVAEELKGVARPILVSVAGGIAELPSTTGIPCEYIPGKTRRWMPAHRWDRYFRDRLIAIADETGASVISFDGVVPYPGFIATKLKRPDLTIVWIRRGLWQKNLLRFALPFQSRFSIFLAPTKQLCAQPGSSQLTFAVVIQKVYEFLHQPIDQ